MSSYSYSLSQFPHGCAPDRLHADIAATAAITRVCDGISTSGDNMSIAFRAELTEGEQDILAGLIAAHSGIPLPPVAQPVVLAGPQTADRKPRIALEKTDASKKNFFSHDWTDPTSWTPAAVRVVDEVASPDENCLNYACSHANIIDTYHGKLWGEDSMRNAAGQSFRVAVKVNGVPKVEQDPHFGAGGDYWVDYELGKVVFLSARAQGDVVTVTYHYATSSVFIVKPDPGKLLSITFAEVQFSDDVILTDTIVFQPYGLVNAFAPHLVAAGAVPSGTLIPLGAPAKYKTMRDYQTEAVKSYPMYPPLGGNGWRGMPRGVLPMDWDYVSTTKLDPRAGMEVRLFLEHDTPFGGTYATCSFYATSEPVS